MRNLYLPLISIIVLILILAGIPRHGFRVDAGDMLEQIVAGEHIIGPVELEQLAEDGSVVLFELHDDEVAYNSSGIPDEIPAIKLSQSGLEPGAIGGMFEEEKIYVLHSMDESYARQTWIYLTQLGIEHILVLDVGAGMPNEKARFVFTPEK